MKNRRFLSILLTVCMMVSMLPTAAFAAGSTTMGAGDGGNGVTSIGASDIDKTPEGQPRNETPCKDEEEGLAYLEEIAPEGTQLTAEQQAFLDAHLANCELCDNIMHPTPMNMSMALGVSSVANIAELNEALSNRANTEIMLTGNITGDAKIPSGNTFDYTIDLNGKTLDGGGSLSAISHNGTGTLTIKDGSQGGRVKSDSTRTIGNISTGTVTVSGGTVENGGAGEAISNYSTGIINVSGGTVESPIHSAILNNNGTTNVSGAAVIRGGDKAMARAPKLIDVTAKASVNYSGDPLVDYKADDIERYRYIKFAPPHSHCVCGGNISVGGHTSHVSKNYTEFSGTGGELTTGNYYLTGDVTLTSGLIIGNGQVVNLCLNGFKLDGNNGPFSVIEVRQTGELNLCDCSGTGTGQITGGKGYYYNREHYIGGGIYNLNILNLYGGNITQNGTTDISSGGGVYNGKDFNMYGGKITNNTSTDHSGGESGGGVEIMDGGTFTMYDGEISGNMASSGGGMNNRRGDFDINGGSIIDNTATKDGGGVYSNSVFKLGGDVIISGNTVSGAASNVYLANGRTIEITSALTGGTVGVNMQTNGVFTSGTAVNGSTYIGKFTSDNSGYTVEAKGSQLELKALPIATPGTIVLNGTVSGVVGTPLPANTTITATLSGDTFHAATLENTPITDMFTNIPAGITATASNVTATTALVTFTGTPTAAASGAITAYVPANIFGLIVLNSGIDISAENISGGSWSITNGGGVNVPVTGITLNKSTMSLYSNASPQTGTLTATISPANASDKAVSWSSSNTAVATVANGVVTAVANGTATITATTKDGGYTASCVVRVSTYSSGGPIGGSSGDNSENDFWMSIKNKIEKADPGDVIKINAGGYDRLPQSVVDTLVQNSDVSLVIVWDGGTITIPAGKAPKNEPGRIYWTFSQLAEMYAGTTESSVLKPVAGTNPETGGPGKYLPVADGGELIMLEAPNGTAGKAITPPHGDFKAEAFVGTADAKNTKSNVGAVILTITGLLVVLYGTGLWFWKKKKAKA